MSYEYSIHIFLLLILIGTRGSAVVKALRYKPEGREFEIQ
jgi:hypothetical protein